jgi:hypothetical protein
VKALEALRLREQKRAGINLILDDFLPMGECAPDAEMVRQLEAAT